MKTNSFTTMKRALALLLALTLFAALPALSEDIPLELDEASGLVLPEADALELDALPELADDIVIDGDGGLDLSLSEDDLDADSENTSKGVPDPMRWTVTLYSDFEHTMTVKDWAIIVTPKGNIASWTNSNDEVVKISRDKMDKNKLRAYPLKPGVTNMVITLTTGKAIKLKLTIEPDPKVLTKLSFKQKKVTLYTGMDLDLVTMLSMEPLYPDWHINFKTSNPEVLPFSKDCIVTAMKPGQATITGVSDNGLEASMEVVVKRNCTELLSDAPTAASARKLSATWTLLPQSLEQLGDGKVACKLWVLNGAASTLSTLKNIDMSIYTRDNTGDTLIARFTFDKVDVNCDSYDDTTLTVTIPTGLLYCSGINFTQLKAKDLRFQLNKTPSGVISGVIEGTNFPCLYRPVSIPVVGEGGAGNPVKYRALLVSESDFYWPNEKNKNERWEHITRNKGDVVLMQNMLKRVKTPDGGRYAVTTQNNTSLKQLRQLVKKTFADADKNDVSLFFIATHGDSADSSAEKYTGALFMASIGEKAPEYLTLVELRDMLLEIPGKVIVILESCGSGAAVKSNGASGMETVARAAEAFDAQVVDVFRSADPGLMESNYAANTGELRKVNKFYVLTASGYREESYGGEPTTPGKNGYNYFTQWLTEGVGKSGSMPADEKFAGNENDMVDLHELYRYISNVGDWNKIWIKSKRSNFFQHVQVYPSDLRYTLFK